MRRRRDGQSLVEMALVSPILLIILFGIIDMGYLIFAYTTVSQAARSAAETASKLPPYPTWLALKGTGENISVDGCVNSIYTSIRREAPLFLGSGGLNGGEDMTQYVTISYPEGNDTRNLTDRGPIQVDIEYPVQGLTPLFQLLNVGDGTGAFTLRVSARRSLQSLGLDLTNPGNQACAQDLADWQKLNQ